MEITDHPFVAIGEGQFGSPSETVFGAGDIEDADWHVKSTGWLITHPGFDPQLLLQSGNNAVQRDTDPTRDIEDGRVPAEL